MWWGYSECLDLQEEIKSQTESEKRDELNFLLVGSGDARHILKTISKTYSHPKKKINFFVLEPTLELYARQMMLISTALQPSENLGLLEKSRLFMEIYGNTLVRENTYCYITQKANQLIDIVTNTENIVPLFDLKRLKFKERDGIENIFKYWKAPTELNMSNLWDSRLRKSLGVRYDTRVGVFDWDYHMRLVAVGGDRINLREYKNWRLNGVAFTWLDTDFSKGNPTLISGIVKFQDRLIHHGYCGDIVMGPHATYGFFCEDKEMLKKSQNQYLKRATDVTERNVLRMMSEIANKEPYVHQKSPADEENLGVVITELCEPVEEKIVSHEKCDDVKKEELKIVDVGSVTVSFLPVGFLRNRERLAKFQGMFDGVFLAYFVEKDVDEGLLKLGRSGSVVFVEGERFMVGVRKEELAEFGSELKKKMSSLGCEEIGDFDPVQNAIAKFTVRENH